MSLNTAFTPARKAMIYCLACELAGVAPELSSDTSAEDVFRVGSEFGVGAMVASALLRAGLGSDSARTALNASVRRAILMDNERKSVSLALTSAGIRHAFLKGSVLKDMYRSVGLREMTDCDVLFDPSHRPSVREVMLSLGYTVASYGTGCHDVYIKQPLYNFEMHVALFSSIESETLSGYFEGAMDRTLTQEGTLQCAFSPEDQYVYLKAHEYKHYSISGTGIRSLLDTYVYAEAVGDKLDWEYIRGELSKLNISDFCDLTLALSRKLFSIDYARELYFDNAHLTDEEERLLSYYLGSGLYGNMKNKVANAISNNGGRFSKLIYLLRRIFPPMEWYKVNAPFYYKHKVLIPLYVIARAVKRLFTSPRKHINELNVLIKSEGKTNNESDLQKKG